VIHRLFGAALSAVLLGGSIVSSPVVAQSRPDDPSARLAGRSVTIVKSPTDVTEGDRYAVVVKVGSPTKAKKVELQVRSQDILGNPIWETAKKRQVSGTRKHRLPMVAGAENPVKLRALVTYGDGQKVRSRTSRVTTWRWFDLHLFRPYYATEYVSNHSASNLRIAGAAYVGWYGYSYGRTTAWESRHTPGRHCTAFRGVAGVTDRSADGSSAEISIVADETTTVYRSPSLVPGAAHRFEVPLARPYRIAVTGRMTSTAAASPAIGAPQLLCDYATGESPS
jgi:hypothetical protein